MTDKLYFLILLQTLTLGSNFIFRLTGIKTFAPVGIRRKKMWKQRDGETLHSEKLHILYSTNIIWAIKRRVRLAGHASCMKAIRNIYKILDTKFWWKSTPGK